MRIIVTRHSSTVWNQEGRLQGWQDSALTKQGKEDAKKLKKELENYKIDAIYSSPLLRAKQTAQILFEDNIIYDDRLKEMNFGDLEGKKLESLLKDPIYLNLWNQPRDHYRLPHGESYLEVKTRLHSFLQDAYKLHSNDTIFLTIHGMLFIILHGMVLNLDTKQLTTINQTVVRGCSISIFEYDGTSFKIDCIGKDSHLPIMDKKISYAK